MTNFKGLAVAAIGFSLLAASPASAASGLTTNDALLAKHLQKAPAFHMPKASKSASKAPGVSASATSAVAHAQIADASCTGVHAWSLLCPGAQVIGISY